MAESPGQASPLVRDLMHIGVVTCRAGTSLAEAARMLSGNGLESLIVLDENGHAVGRLGRAELVFAFACSGMTPQDCREAAVESIMQTDILELPPDIPATAAVQIMLDQQVREAFLMHHDGGFRWPAAVLRFDDVLHYLAKDHT